MPTSVIGLFDNSTVARKAVTELVKSGLDKKAVDVISDSSNISKLVDELVERGYAKERARQYAEAVKQGAALVAAEAEDDAADSALEILNRFEARSPEEVIERGGREESEETETAQVVEEELQVGKRQTTGGKRLTTSTTEREVQQPVTLREEEVEVERHRVDRTLRSGEADQAFEEKTIEMTEVSERPVVSKEARVKEEVVLRKQASEHQEVVKGTVRSTNVHVEDLNERPADKSKK